MVCSYLRETMSEPEITDYGSGLFKKDAIDSDY